MEGPGMPVYKDQDTLWPAECPPNNSLSVPLGVYLRLVPANPVTAADFQSGHTCGKKRPKKCDECTWRACSVWLSTTLHEKLAGLTKLPNLSDMKFIAHVEITIPCGKIRPHNKDKDHLSFWMHNSFYPEKAVIKIMPL
jgi:hypothetical protein